MAEQYNGIAVILNDQTRQLFKLMNFQEIPDEAKYIAFLDDGDACFLADIDRGPGLVIDFPRMAMISYYENVTVEM